jgi:uncharacterized protein YidB (DUF937 family)
MGLFDTLAKQAIGSFLGTGSSQPADILTNLLQQAGGLPGLMQRFQQAGLTEVFASWVSTDENQPIQPTQMEQALGSDAIAGLANRLGLDRQTILPLLSQFLPQVIDQLTPSGRIDEPSPSTETLQNVLASVMKSGLSGIFSSR